MHDTVCNNRPLPALRATLSRLRERGWGRGVVSYDLLVSYYHDIQYLDLWSGKWDTL